MVIFREWLVGVEVRATLGTFSTGSRSVHRETKLTTMNTKRTSNPRRFAIPLSFYSLSQDTSPPQSLSFLNIKLVEILPDWSKQSLHVYRLSFLDKQECLLHSVVSKKPLLVPDPGSLVCARDWPCKIDLFKVVQLEYEFLSEGEELVEQHCRVYLVPAADLPCVRFQR